MIRIAALVTLLTSPVLVPYVSYAAAKPPALHVVKNSRQLLAAAAAIGPAGGTISLAPGAYVIDKTITFTKVNMVNIVGSGWDTTIVRKGDGDAIAFVDCGFCAVQNLLINGDSAAKSGSGIAFRGQSSSCKVDFCRICGFAESGVVFDGDPKAPQSSNTVSNCHFIGNLGDQLRSLNNNDFYITGNQFGTHSKNPRTGCLLDHSSAGTYTMNYHWGNVNAFRMLNSNFNRIENNRFEESRESGMVIGDEKGWCALHIVTGNTIHTNSKAKSGAYPAVIATNAHAITFCTNQVFSWDANSVKHKSSLIFGAGCARWIVKDNIFGNNVESALVYDEKAAHIVKDNLTN